MKIKTKRACKKKPYRKLLETQVVIITINVAVGVVSVRNMKSSGRWLLLRQLHDGERLKGGRRRRGRREERVVVGVSKAHKGEDLRHGRPSSEDLKEDLEEEGEPVQYCPPYLQRPRRAHHLRLGKLRHHQSINHPPRVLFVLPPLPPPPSSPVTFPFPATAEDRVEMGCARPYRALPGSLRDSSAIQSKANLVEIRTHFGSLLSNQNQISVADTL